MTNEELLEQLSKRFDTIDSRLNTIDARLEKLEEGQDEVRTGVNALLDWAEDCGNSFRFPLPRLGERKAQ